MPGVLIAHLLSRNDNTTGEKETLKRVNDPLTGRIKNTKDKPSGRGAAWFSVPEWGSGGRRFESGRPDQKNQEASSELLAS